MKPKISIIIATLNAGSSIESSILSVIRQTYPNRELIIIDGGSTDNTVEILKKHSDKIEYFESKRDRGIAHAWNKGLSHASGEWILFLGADDALYEEETLTKVTTHLNKMENLGAKIAYGKVLLLDNSNRHISERGAPWNIAQTRLFIDNKHIHHQGVFHHRTLFDEYGVFDEDFGIIGMDYEFIIRYLKDHEAQFINEFVSKVHVGGVSWSGKYALKSNIAIYKALRKNGKVPPMKIAFLGTWWKALCAYLLSCAIGDEMLLRLVLSVKKLKGLS